VAQRHRGIVRQREIAEVVAPMTANSGSSSSRMWR
jgi:hypothetical protein